MKSFSDLRGSVSRFTGSLSGQGSASASVAGMGATTLACMLDSIPINVIYADLDGIIRYMNKSSTELFQQLEHLMPVKAHELIGNSYDIFHKNPERIRRILADPSNLPHKATISFGNEMLSLHATAVYDDHGNYVGVMQTWSKVTEQVFLEKSQKKLRESLAEASTKVSEATGRLNRITGSVDEGIRQTAVQAGSAAASAQTVSGNAQSVAAATEEMTASIREIARSAAEAARVAANAVSVAADANARIATLGESSSQIGNVIKIINSIAQQTKLLALNATIEAARAGEAGKGFAVVANEVKELAKETADATEDINKKIEAIQGDTSSAVATINEISSIIKQINDIQVTIASAVEEQTATTNEINRSISDIADGSGGIAHNAEVVAKDAELAAAGIADAVSEIGMLGDLAAGLKQLMSELDSGFIKSEEMKRH